MSNEIKKILESGQNGDQDITNLKSNLEKAEQEKASALKRAADAEFTASFNQLSNVYPHATEFKDKIREKVDLGYSVDDALISTLQRENKLETADQISARENKGAGMGGSAAINDLNTEKKDKTLADLENEFKDAEARGEIILS